MAPKVTIGMPLYNGEQFIEEAVACVLEQTFENFEFIISDNCSTDRSGEICKRLASLDQRIIYVLQKENLGAVGNFNELVNLANGEYFKWAAHDDLMESTFIERCVEVLDRDRSVVWCHSKSDMIDINGISFRNLLPSGDEELATDDLGKRTWKGHPRDNFDSNDPIARFRGVVLGTNWCVDHYGLFRLEALKETQLLPNFYGAEKTLISRISLIGKYYEIQELLFYQRIHDRASSNLDSAAAQASFIGSSTKFHRLLFTRLQVPKAHLKGLLLSKLSPWQKIRGSMVVLTYFFQFSKWRKVISKTIQGSGLGGGGRRMLQSIEQKANAENGSNGIQKSEQVVEKAPS